MKDKVISEPIPVPGYDPERDIQAVDQTGYVDLKKANAESVVPAVEGLTEERFNGIDDPNSIGSRPSDVFEQMQANKAIVGYKAPSSSDGSADEKGE